MKTKRIMRGILSGALAAATVCSSAFAYANPAAETTNTTTSVSASAVAYAATTSAVYMRSEPQNGAAIVCTIPEDTTIQEVSQNGNWYQVSYNGKTGYIYKKFLKQTGETAAPAQQPQSSTSTPAQKTDEPQETIGTVYTTAGVNMRTQPKNGSAVICVVPQGTQVQKTGTSGNWVQISYNNQTGYVYNKYLSDKSTGAAQNTTQPSNTTDNTTTTTKGEEFSDVLASKTTYYNASVTGRSTNIRLATEAINGTVLQPGETFSLNGIVGRGLPERHHFPERQAGRRPWRRCLPGILDGIRRSSVCRSEGDGALLPSVPGIVHTGIAGCRSILWQSGLQVREQHGQPD